MTWDEVKKQIAEKGWQFVSDFGANVLTHKLYSEKVEDGKVVVGTDGKPVMILDPKKLRSEAPHLAKTLADEAEFSALIIKLPLALQKNMEEKMGPAIGMGPHLPVLGDNQRADIVLTAYEMTVRAVEGGREKAREEAVEMLRQLAEVDDRAEWNRRAVAFRLMREREDQYLGAQLTEQGKTAWAAILRDVDNVRRWMNADAVLAEASANQIFAEVRRMNRANVFSKIWNGLVNPLRF